MTSSTPSTIVRPADPTLLAALRLAALFALIKLLFQFALTLWTSHLGYGYFRDEFYYIACGRHLAWGYVDHGPIVAVQARLGEILFGDSVFGIRILSAAAGAKAVFLTGCLTWALGGRGPAQALAMLALIVAPQYTGVDSYLSMNSFEPVFWAVCVFALLMILREASARTWWMIFGVSAGIGLLNKPSMLFFLVALGLGLLCTPQRRVLFTRWAAVGIVLLTVIALPNVIWQIHNHWPTLEFLHNGKVEHKNAILSPLAFFGAQVGAMHPLNTLLWITGIVALLRARSIRDARWLGLTYVFFFGIMLALHAKDYYLAPIYPAFLAAGAIAWEHRFGALRPARQRRTYAIPVFACVLAITGLLILPMASPVLPPAAWVRYTTAMHLQSTNTENAKTSALPQFFADRFGWQQEADIVATAFRSLSPEDQRTVCVYGDNYGEAGALDFLARREEPRLPPAISRHNNYWIWGPHGCTAELVIAVTGDRPDELLKVYRNVTVLGHLDNPYAMPYEHKNIYLLRGRRPERPFIWDNERHYI
ncbi:MAG TPA: glycosyltransferase family 39 protein [Acidobacteriaceae bacterium]|jgi:hypothetical protein